MLDANRTQFWANKGGRPCVAGELAVRGSGLPGCAGKLYLTGGLTATVDHRTGKPRVGRPCTSKLRCGGTARDRISCKRTTGIDVRPVIDLITGRFAADDEPVLAFQRVAGNAHELDALQVGLRKIQARLSATDDDDDLDALVAERKTVKARIEGFRVVPDRFDYTPTGQTVAQTWKLTCDTLVRTGFAAVDLVESLAEVVGQGGGRGDGVRPGLDLDCAVTAGGFDEPLDGPAGQVLDPSADGQGAGDDGDMSFDGVAQVVVDRQASAGRAWTCGRTARSRGAGGRRRSRTTA